MKFNRRSILALFSAAPIAAPAFGKVVVAEAAKKMALSSSALSGMGALMPEAPEYAVTNRIAPGKIDILKLIGIEWEDRLKRARERMNALERNSHLMFNCPSWSPAFQQYVRNAAYEERRLELRSVSEKVDDLVRNWWKENGDQSSAEKVQDARNYGESQGSVGAASNRY